MTIQVQLRRGTTTQLAAYTPLAGEVIANTTTDELHLGDGSVGGVIIPNINNVVDAIENLTEFTVGRNATSVTLTNSSQDVNLPPASNTQAGVLSAALHAKLEALESSKNLGTYTSVSALTAANPDPEPGDFAFVDAGSGQSTDLYVWDETDSVWQDHGQTSAETASSVKIKYESNPDTNAFTDSAQAKVAMLPDSISELYGHEITQGPTSFAISWTLDDADQDITINSATTTVAGLMSAADKIRVNMIVPASTTVRGLVELATTAETTTGTDTVRAATPAGVASALTSGLSRVGLQSNGVIDYGTL